MSRFAIRTPTPDLAASIDYYERLGFSRIERDGPAAWFTDGAVVVQVDPDRFARTGLLLFVDDPATLAAAAPTRAVEHEGGFLISDPNGVHVWLLAGDAPQPVGEPAIPGRFAGLSVEAVDLQATMAFWRALGFEVAAGGPEQGWTQLAREGACGVSVMGMRACPHLFPNPGLTYFNSGRNPEVIAALRDAGIPLAEEITVFNDRGEVDNVILTDPGGTGFFVFND